VGKRRFCLGQVMAKLAPTTETAIAVTFLVMNLERLLWQLLFVFFSLVVQVLLQFHPGQRKGDAPQFSPIAA
jgi:transposase, IS5 family